MANVLSEEKKQQVLTLGRLGWSLRKIERETGVRRETAGLYLKAAGVRTRTPRQVRLRPKAASGDQVSTDFEEAKPASGGQVSTDFDAVRPARQRSESACEPYRELIEAAMRKGRNAMAIYQDLVTEHGFASKYASVRRYVNQLKERPTPEARVVIMTEPGQEAQVDYGDGPMVRHPETGKYRRARLFVMTLGYSRKSVRLLTFKSSSKIWAELHETAFRRLGGVPKIVVLDNLREGVIKPDVYDATINPVYEGMLRHYGAIALPCRVRDPDRKGKVEAGVGHAKRTPLKGMRFEAIEEGQTYLDRWEANWADTRIHGTTKQQVSAMYAEEKPELLPLPIEPFRYYEFGQRTVHLDGHMEIEGAYYCAPPGNIGRLLPVQWDEQTVRIMDPNSKQLLREYQRKERGRYSTPDEFRPKRTPKSTLTLLAMAAHSGKHVAALCASIHREHGEVGVKWILGIRALIKKHGATAVDDACGAALEMGMASYRFVRRYLERRTRLPLELRQVDPIIRELSAYRDHINRITKENEDEHIGTNTGARAITPRWNGGRA